MIDATDNTFLEDVKEGLVLVDFYATWCAPCRAMMPVIDALQHDIKIVRVDVDKCPQTAMKYGVISIPTLVLMENGNIIKQTAGMMPLELLKEFIKR